MQLKNSKKLKQITVIRGCDPKEAKNIKASLRNANDL